MLPNGIDPPFKMLTTKQKIRATERMLKELKLSGNPSDQIPGSFLAKQRRKRHDSSMLVFPENKSTRTNKDEYKTNYSVNFKSPTKARPSTPRPCSPTRRNNPHPSKKFLTWRIPTRVFNYGTSDDDVTFLRSNIGDTFLRFYDDYRGKKEHLKEMNTELLLELTKSYAKPAFVKENCERRRQRDGTVELTSHAKDLAPEQTLPSLLRKSWSPDQTPSGKNSQSHKHKLAPLFIKPDYQPLFQSWYDTASSGVKKKAAKTVADLEENFIHKALESALKPDAIEAIEDWLLTADEEEREIAMQFIQTILFHSFEKGKVQYAGGGFPEERNWRSTPSPQYERKRTPISLKSPSSPATHIQTTTAAKQHHHHYNRKGCERCAKLELENALKQLQELSSAPDAVIPDVTEILNPLHPEVIAQKESRKRFVLGQRMLKRSKKTNKVNKGSCFENSKQQKLRNFAIHPEW